MSNSVRPHGLQHTRHPCPSLTPRVCLNSCLLSQWCHPVISSSVTSSSSCLQSFPAWESFPMNCLFASGGPSIGASASVFPMNIQDWIPLRVFSNSSKASVLCCLAFFMVQLSHLYMMTGITIALTISNFVGKMMSLLLNMLSRFIIIFLPRSKYLLISWLQLLLQWLEIKKIKSDTVSTVSPCICHEVMGPDTIILVSWMLSFKQAFSLSSFTFIKRLFSSFSLYTIRVCHLHIWGCCYFSQQLDSSLWIIQPGISQDVGTPLQYSCLENPMVGGTW